MKILIIDNYDSFTYNLYQMVGRVLQGDAQPAGVEVVRNNQITLGSVMNGGYDRIVISPGPGSPDDPAYFGRCAEVIRGAGTRMPVLGVCLGMQGIAHVFGGKVIRARVPMHGKTSEIMHETGGVFAGLPQKMAVMRYHSLVVDEARLPLELVVTARTRGRDSEVMGLRHRRYPIQGIQFHPESFASEGGDMILRNFLKGAA